MKKFILLFTLSVFQLCRLNAQIDTCFWFAAPWVTPDHWWRDDIKLHISTFSAPTTTVRVRQPGAIAPNKYDTTIVINANSTFDYVFWRDKLASLTNIGYDSLETRPADAVLPYGLYISSSSNITVVYDIVTRPLAYYNPETFSLKGQNALGTSFMCPFQTKQNNQIVGNLAGTPAGVILPKQQINIVASKANTTVWITPKCNVVGHLANITYSILLNNPGDAYTIENTVQTTNVIGSNLAGTEITSNKPIAVTVADDSVRGVGGCYDLIGDQIVPLSVIGTDYVLIKGFLNAVEPEGAFILGTQNNTTITVLDAFITNTVINKGDTYFYNTTQNLTHVYSDKPVYCLQLTGNGCEYGTDILPPLNCSGSNLVSFSRNTSQNFYLHILCKNGTQNSFTLNNSSSTVTVPITAADFTLAPGTATLPGGPYYGARISLGSTTLLPLGSYTIGNSMDVFALGVFDGGTTTGGLYHYMSSFLNSSNVTVNNSASSICLNSTNTIALTGTVSGSAITGVWTSANGTGTFAPYTSTLNTVSTIYTLSTLDTVLSSLKFYLTSIGSCNPKTDSINIIIYQRPHITVTGNFSVCSSTPSITLAGSFLNAMDASWSGGNGGTFAGSGPNTTYTPSPTDLISGSAIFALTSQTAQPGCSNSTKTISVTFVNSPTISALGSPNTLCFGQTATIIPSGANSYTISGNNFVVSPTITTTYSVNGTNTLNCPNSNPALVTITVNPLPNVTASASPTLICTGQQASLTASGAVNYGWNPSIPMNGIVSPTVTITYTIQGIDANNCSKNTYLTLTVDPCTGLEEDKASLDQIQVVPNPSSGLFNVYIGSFSEDVLIEVNDVLGRLVLTKKTTSQSTSVDLTKFANGLYYLKVKSGAKEEVIKIIKE